MLLLPPRLQSLKWEDLRPKEQDYIKANANGRVRFLWVFRDGYMSTIAFKLCGGSKHKTIKIKEAERYIQATDKTVVCDYLMYHRIGGWNCYIEKKQCRYGQAPQSDYLEQANEYYEVNNDGPWAASVATDDEMERWFRNSYKYFGLKGGYSTAFFSKPVFYKPYAFIREYMANLPHSETYCKIGLPNMAVSKSMCHLSTKGEKAIKKFLKANADNECLRRAKVPEIKKMIGSGITDLRELHKQQALEGLAKRIAQHNAKAYLEPKELLNYLLSQGIHLSDMAGKNGATETNAYFSYLTLCQRLGYSFEDKGTYYPLDFALAKQVAEGRQVEKENEERRKKREETKRKLSIIAERYGGAVYEGGIEIKPLSSVEEFIKMGNFFHNCVGRMGYDEKMADGKCLIVVVYVDGTPTECVEIDTKSRKVVQERGLYNSTSALYHQLNPLVVQYANSMANA